MSAKSRLGSDVLDYAFHLYKTQSGCDVLLVTQEQSSFRVHEMVLAASSECFKEQLNADDKKEFLLPGINF